ncbi:o-succinylbenzoate synthase [Thalassobacillus devorans]|uniref:o-succinylbenzoate synthase n=1 Tax=Thalassobacillus devorans TaxID=279813 RepID=UPI0020CAB1E8|nr:o-succinylbenzoate synthase [Thalassobacillus devorans]
MRKIEMPLRYPFQTHAGQVNDRELIIIEIMDNEGRKGFGEVTAFSTPFYTSETIESAWSVLRRIFLPAVKWHQLAHPSNMASQLSIWQGNQMAKAGLEAALWDLCAKQVNKSLSMLIGGSRSYVESGVVLSLSDKLDDVIANYQEEGYRRYKLKVEKYNEGQMIEEIKTYAPSLPVMIDANGIYKEKDFPYLQSLDSHGLMMIEQPFRPGDFYLHQQLQHQLETPLCLDESVTSLADAKQAVRMGSCQIINIKISRVGGMTEALAIHEWSRKNNIPVWCGGMVESGISKAHNIALASLDGFTIPGDISASSRFWERDLIIPEVEVQQGRIKVPLGPGIGFKVDEEYLQFVTQDTYIFQPEKAEF